MQLPHFPDDFGGSKIGQTQIEQRQGRLKTLDFVERRPGGANLGHHTIAPDGIAERG